MKIWKKIEKKNIWLTDPTLHRACEAKQTNSFVFLPNEQSSQNDCNFFNLWVLSVSNYIIVIGSDLRGTFLFICILQCIGWKQYDLIIGL